MPGRARTRPSGRTIRTVIRPLGRPAFRRVHQRRRRLTGLLDLPPSQRKQRLDRLTSRPQPTPATAIARQRIKETARSGSFRPALPASPPAGAATPMPQRASPVATTDPGLAGLPFLASSPRCLQARYRTRSSTKLFRQRVCAPRRSFGRKRMTGNGGGRDKTRISGGRLPSCAHSLHRPCTGLCTDATSAHAARTVIGRISSPVCIVRALVAFDSQAAFFPWHAIPRALQRSGT